MPNLKAERPHAPTEAHKDKLRTYVPVGSMGSLGAKECQVGETIKHGTKGHDSSGGELLTRVTVALSDGLEGTSVFPQKWHRRKFLENELEDYSRTDRDL